MLAFLHYLWRGNHRDVQDDRAWERQVHPARICHNCHDSMFDHSLIKPPRLTIAVVPACNTLLHSDHVTTQAVNRLVLRPRSSFTLEESSHRISHGGPPGSKRMGILPDNIPLWHFLQHPRAHPEATSLEVR